MGKRTRIPNDGQQRAIIQAQRQLGNRFVSRHLIPEPAGSTQLQRLGEAEALKFKAWLEQSTGEELLQAFLKLQTQDPGGNAVQLRQIKARLAELGPHWIFLIQQMHGRVQQTTGGIRQRLRHTWHTQSHYRKHKRKLSQKRRHRQ